MENLKFTGERVVIDDMHKYPAVLQHHVARYNFALEFVVGKYVLDAACGTGYGVDLMSQLAKEVDGCDVSLEATKFAKEKYPKHYFFEQDLNNPEWDLSYDVITSFETIEHLDSPEEFLKWVSKHCDTFIFSIPISAPSGFHKHAWTTPQIVEMITKYFPNTRFLLQEGLNFYYLTNQTQPGYIVGISSCTK